MEHGVHSHSGVWITGIKGCKMPVRTHTAAYAADLSTYCTGVRYGKHLFEDLQSGSMHFCSQTAPFPLCLDNEISKSCAGESSISGIFLCQPWTVPLLFVGACHMPTPKGYWHWARQSSLHNETLSHTIHIPRFQDAFNVIQQHPFQML